MRALYLLTRMRLLDVLRTATSAGLFFGLPVVLLVLTAIVFANGHPFERRTIVIAAPAATAAPVLAALAAFPEVRTEAVRSPELAMGKLRARMANAVLLADGPSGWALRASANDRLLAYGLRSALPTPPRIEILPLPRWGYIHFLFPGLLSSSIVLAGLFGMGYNMVRYRQSLFLKKLATTPLRRSTFLAAQLLSRALLVLGQVALLVAAGAVLFALPLSLRAVLEVTLLALLGLLVFSGVGFAIACAIKTESLMMDLLMSILLPFTLLSGIFFPVDVLPAPLAWLSSLLPGSMLVDATRAALLYGGAIPAELGQIAGLCIWGAATFALSLAVFRWQS
jgi:ABC-type polysaccharide/polyol phosphate export permease